MYRSGNRGISLADPSARFPFRRGARTYTYPLGCKRRAGNLDRSPRLWSDRLRSGFRLPSIFYTRAASCACLWIACVNSLPFSRRDLFEMRSLRQRTIYSSDALSLNGARAYCVDLKGDLSQHYPSLGAATRAQK